jgi:hypothetical protein
MSWVITKKLKVEGTVRVRRRTVTVDSRECNKRYALKKSENKTLGRKNRDNIDIVNF